ncbi:MAG TPA: monofunctional biosynthetic peptidoglycan transglycosylase [Chitinophagaceae bacterium]|nr:monofunctional biosynthetic peptidoglycan transglycosylase [Chitinophagaceae bacterium]
MKKAVKGTKAAPKRSFGSRLWLWTKRVFLILFVGHLLYLFLLKWVSPPFTLTQLGSLIGGHGLKRDYVDADEMAYTIRLAVIAAEDQKFPMHSGFDWVSIEKAMEHNEKKPKKVRGASTISQQVAKNVFLWQGRDWVRKGLEVYFTKMIEWIWGKERILEMYLNVIEMGEGIFGVQAAAQAYFKKDAARLSRREAAMIAACLPSPKRYTVKPVSNYVSKRTGVILRQMNNIEGMKELQPFVLH